MKFAKKPEVKWTSMSPLFEDSKWDLAYWIIKQISRGEPTITSANDGTHSKGTLHGSGEAVDVRINDWLVNPRMVARMIAAVLGEPWLVVLEKTHLHIQTSRVKNIRNPEHVEAIGEGAFLE